MHESGGLFVEQVTHFCDLHYFGEEDYSQLTSFMVPASNDPTNPSYLSSLSSVLKEGDIPLDSRSLRLTHVQWKVKSRTVGTLTHAFI